MPVEEIVAVDGAGRACGAPLALRRMSTPWAQARGLIGLDRIDGDAAYLFRHCARVHTRFMRCAIDVALLDKDMRILRVETMRPWRAASGKAKGARHALELAEGAASAHGVEPGRRMEVRRARE